MGCMKFDQFCCTWRSLEDPERFCPFCPTELERRGRTELYRADNWMLLENEFPRADTEQMMLIVPVGHRTIDDYIRPEDWQNIGVLFDYCVERFGFEGGALLMRFGDPRDHAGTIDHLHLNVIQPVREGGCSLPIAKRVEGPYGHEKDYVRFHSFVRQIDERGGTDWLFSPKGIAETQPRMV
ncbi:MAG: hypothetical protein Q7R59_03110 [bacterium]|nr:hypothetical protein [bacterium]